VRRYLQELECEDIQEEEAGDAVLVYDPHKPYEPGYDPNLVEQTVRGGVAHCPYPIPHTPYPIPPTPYPIPPGYE